MTLNLDKNKSVLVHAWKEVLDERNPIDWALFGYDGLTYDLNLVGKGDGGLNELIEEFNSGKIQYALCRVKIKEKNIEKIVLINWQGEGAPLVRKGVSANHVDIVRGFFKGVHISLHARTDEDVEPDVVLAMVSKAIAGEGIKLVPSTDESDSMNDTGSRPIGSNYKRVNPQEEINAKAKDDFWRKDQAEEERRRREEKGLERKFSQAEVKLLRRESQDYFEREEEAEKVASPKPQINGGTTITTNGGGSGINKSNSVSPTPPTAPAVRGFSSSPSSGGVGGGGAERTAALQASMPMKKNNSDLVRSRIKSFDGGSSGPVFPSSTTTTPPRMSNGINSINKMASISGGGKSPSPIVSSSSTPTPPPPVNGDSLSVLKRKQLFESGKSPSSENSSNTITRRNPADEIRLMQEEAAKKLEEEKKKKQQEKKKEQPITTSQPEVTKPSVVVANDYENNFDDNNDRNVTSPTVHFQSPPLPVSPPPAQQQPAFFNNPGVVSPTKSSISPTPPVVEKVPSPTPPSPTPPPPQQFQNAKEDHVPIREDSTVRSAAHEQHNGGGNMASSPSPIPASPVPANNSYTNGGDSSSIISINITPEMGVCARALYDYQAADDTEITFDPGDIIRNIEKIDDGWWEGMGPNEQYGLFPANYVELLT